MRIIRVCCIALALTACGAVPGAKGSVPVTKLEVGATGGALVITVTATSCGPFEVTASRHRSTIKVSTRGHKSDDGKCGVFIPSNSADENSISTQLDVPDGVYHIEAGERSRTVEVRGGVVPPTTSTTYTGFRRP